MGTFGPTHWIIIAVLVLVLFGAKRLPDAARGLGRSLRIFKSEMSEMQSEGGQPAPQQPAPAPTPQELPTSQPVQPAPQVQVNPEVHKA
ncbi:Sec-independent protein translocase subunit TatA [Nocardia macrotermitis]|uniref:Sec-independent protein translocase protein TatA n=1 Tax=Nocardia macrotermitis TaxID=2585198 RepID=A0A7K0CUS6_9NOCA|nr:Sec-independent protein translocase subunit TatA [Nocardia macrotermitis]MQY17249.1 Sec-independent protein translocase protein TatA [Nocardia macrotermitis]